MCSTPNSGQNEKAVGSVPDEELPVIAFSPGCSGGHLQGARFGDDVGDLILGNADESVLHESGDNSSTMEEQRETPHELCDNVKQSTQETVDPVQTNKTVKDSVQTPTRQSVQTSKSTQEVLPYDDYQVHAAYIIVKPADLSFTPLYPDTSISLSSTCSTPGENLTQHTINMSPCTPARQTQGSNDRSATWQDSSGSSVFSGSTCLNISPNNISSSGSMCSVPVNVSGGSSSSGVFTDTDFDISLSPPTSLSTVNCSITDILHYLSSPDVNDRSSLNSSGDVDSSLTNILKHLTSPTMDNIQKTQQLSQARLQQFVLADRLVEMSPVKLEEIKISTPVKNVVDARDEKVKQMTKPASENRNQLNRTCDSEDVAVDDRNVPEDSVRPNSHKNMSLAPQLDIMEKNVHEAVEKKTNIVQENGSVSCQMNIAQRKEVCGKPRESYIELIGRAILSKTSRKLALSDITDYIMDEYPYFKTADPTWRNAVRHNLSVNECFIKNGRADSGRGYFWSVHPACVQLFTKGNFTRRDARRAAQLMDKARAKLLVKTARGHHGDSHQRESVMRGYQSYLNNGYHSNMESGGNLGYTRMTSIPSYYYTEQKSSNHFYPWRGSVKECTYMPARTMVNGTHYDNQASESRLQSASSQYQTSAIQYQLSASQQYQDVHTSHQHHDAQTSSQQYQDVQTSSQQYNDVGSSSQQYQDVRNAAQECQDVHTALQQYQGVGTSSQRYQDNGTASQQYQDVQTSSQQYQDASSLMQQYQDVRTSTQEYQDVRTSYQQYQDVRTVSQQYQNVRTSSQYKQTSEQEAWNMNTNTVSAQNLYAYRNYTLNSE